MSARIIYPVTTTWGEKVAELASLVVQTRNLAKQINDTFDSMSATGSAYGPMETEMNLVAGVGAQLYANVHSINLAMAALTQINQIDMGL